MTPTTQEKIIAKYKEYRQQLQQLTNGLIEQAKSQQRQEYKINQLLREFYDLTGKTLHTFDEWKEQNYSIKKGEHAFHFWGKPVTDETGKSWCPVSFLFSEDQVYINAVATAAA